ncbi:MAG: HDOD domain-containing protein [Chitinivibrionales bacterium]|nr:HDOD domain-containing protein [Chitinivibrionales bacterium]
MDSQAIVEVINNVEHIGSSPTVSIKIFEELRKHDYDINVCCQYIAQEPTIAVQIIKLANSPLYYRGNQISSLVQAILYIGVKNIEKILFAIELIGIYKGKQSYKNFSEKMFWKHSLAGALIAQGIAVNIDFDSVEECFLSALLRDLSVLFLRQYLPDLFAQIGALCEEKHLSFSQASESILALHYRFLTNLICSRWDIPPIICNSIFINTTNTADITTIAHCITLSDFILSVNRYEPWDLYYNPEIPTDLFDTHGLSYEKLQSIYSVSIGEVEAFAETMIFLY